jgi:hypothetical protein
MTLNRRISVLRRRSTGATHKKEKKKKRKKEKRKRKKKEPEWPFFLI